MKHAPQSRHDQHDASSHYLRLLAMAALSFLAMYALMYAMVDRMANVHPNINQAWMAGLMTASMVIIELLLMGRMYPRKGWNAAIIALGTLALISLWFAIRQQTAVDDRQFLKSMIPHHAGAILMCEQADLHDPEILALCASIIEGQQAEIDRMHAMLAGSGNATPASDADG